jgi:sn-glycerol 3-phosphate transport system permease protein
MNKKNQLKPVSGRTKKATPLPYLLLMPALALFTAFTYWPFLRTIVFSFALTDKKGNFVKWVGIKNYLRVMTNRAFGEVFANTWYFAAIVCIGTLVVAMILALLAAQQSKGSRIYETLFSMPMAVASAPAATIFIFIMRKEGGVLNALLGTNISWLNDPIYALESVAFITVWLSIGSTFIFLLVGFRNVPIDLIESATLDGAGAFRRAINIMIPLASPQIFFVIFLNITASFRAFGQIKLLTNGGPNGATTTLIYAMYENAFLNGRYETAYVQALILFVIIFVVTRIQTALEEKVVFYS